MEKKKTMNLWQMIALVVLLAGVTISMFFPVLNPTGQKMVSSFETFSQNHEEDEKIGGACKAYLKKIEDDSKREDQEVDCDKFLDDLEGKDDSLTDDENKQRKDALLFPANGIEFLNKSFILDSGRDKIKNYQDKKDDELEKHEKAYLSIYNTYNTSRAVLGFVYFVPLVLIVLVILSFCLKWNKMIAAIVSGIVSLIGAAVAAGLYFMAPKLVSVEEDSVNTIVHNFITQKDVFDLGSNYKDFSSELLSTLWNAMRGNGLLITAVIFLLVLVMAIITMAVGNSQQEVQFEEQRQEYKQNINGYKDQGNLGGFNNISGADIQGGNNGFGGFQGAGGFNGTISNENNGFGSSPFVVEKQKKKEPIVPQPPVKKLGRVRCIEGNSNVPGYKFPEENKIIVGANPTRCQIVINGAPHVSNIHCSIRYNAQRDTYIVKDHSSNGTFVNGARLPKDQAMEYPAGTILSLADGSNKLRLGD